MFWSSPASLSLDLSYYSVSKKNVASKFLGLNLFLLWVICGFLYVSLSPALQDFPSPVTWVCAFIYLLVFFCVHLIPSIIRQHHIANVSKCSLHLCVTVHMSPLYKAMLQMSNRDKISWHISKPKTVIFQGIILIKASLAILLHSIRLYISLRIFEQSRDCYIRCTYNCRV